MICLQIQKIKVSWKSLLCSAGVTGINGRGYWVGGFSLSLSLHSFSFFTNSTNSIIFLFIYTGNAHTHTRREWVGDCCVNIVCHMPSTATRTTLLPSPWRDRMTCACQRRQVWLTSSLFVSSTSSALCELDIGSVKLYTKSSSLVKLCLWRSRDCLQREGE